MNIPVLKNLVNPINALIASSVGLTFFSLNFYIMSNLPGEVNNMCVMGSGLNTNNLIFIGILSIFIGVYSAGLYSLLTALRRKNGLAFTALSGTGFVIGPFTVFCSLCTFTVISLFGLSTVLWFFNQYNLVIRIITIVIVSLGLFLLNRQLDNSCNRCTINHKLKKK